MARHRSIVPFAALVVLTSSPFQPAFCQIGSGIGGSVGSFSLPDARCKGLPYSAEIVSKTVQTLSDGTHITSEQKRVEARDSEGRTRNEIYLSDGAPGKDADQLVLVIISDPIGGQLIHLNPRQKTAMVNSFPAIHRTDEASAHTTAKSQQAVAKPPLQAHSKARPEVEKLGQETIDGVYAEGERVTTVIRAGTQGNDRDITVVTERWRSPDPGIEVLSKTTDPRGDTTTAIKNLSRTEPDPALFQIPPDYKVQAPQQPN
jgi:hypothetical protein